MPHERREYTHVHEDEERDALVLDAGELRGGAVAAEGVHMTADDGVAHDVAEADEQTGEQEEYDGDTAVAGQGHGEGEYGRGHGHALGEEDVAGQDVQFVAQLTAPVADLLEEGKGQERAAQEEGQVVVVGLGPDLGEVSGGDLLEALGEGAERAAAQEDLCAAPEQQHSGQGDDEGRDADVRDPEALPGARDRSDDQGEHEGQDPGDIVLDHHDRGGRGDECGQRADGQVDVPGDDDDHHADGENQDVAVLKDEVGDVVRLEQDSVGPYLEEDDDQPEGDEHPVLAHVAAGRVQEEAAGRRGRGRGLLAGALRGVGGGLGHSCYLLSLVIWRMRTSWVACARDFAGEAVAAMV